MDSRKMYLFALPTILTSTVCAFFALGHLSFISSDDLLSSFSFLIPSTIASVWGIHRLFRDVTAWSQSAQSVSAIKAFIVFTKSFVHSAIVWVLLTGLFLILEESGDGNNGMGTFFLRLFHAIAVGIVYFASSLRFFSKLRASLISR